MEKARKWKRVIAILLTVTMIFQNGASVTASGDLHMVPETNVESEAAAQAAAESEAKAKAESEAAAQAAAESEAKAKAESEAAAQAAAESEAKAKAESEAAAKAAAESEAQAKAESEAAAKAAAESEAKAKAESESQAAAESEAAKAESESQAKETETTKPEESETTAPTEKETEAPTEKETEKESETPAPAESEATKPAESETAPVTYKVTFEQNAALHGTISVDNAAVDVSAYYKEVEQNQAFRFTVTASEGYEVEFVRLDNVDLPKTENPNEYQIPNVTKDSQVVVSYKEVPQSEAEGSDTSEETAESESEPAESETAVQNLVTFTGENVTITANGTAVTDGTAMALDGKIVFTIVPAEGFAVTEVLVDGSIPARTTGNPNEYIIEGIQTDATVVSIATQAVETEVAETESEVVESETEVPETESETEIQTEATMPAQILNANVGNVQVTVNAAEGVLPEGTIVKATMVSSDMVRDAVEAQAATEGKEVVDLIAVDVTLYDSEGNEIQPQGEVNVSFNNVSVGDETSDSAAVYHVDDQGLEAEKIAETSVENGTVGFQAEHFSIYTLAALSNSDANEIEVLNDENQEFYTLRIFQIVKKLVGDEMQEESQTALPSQQFEANTPYTVDVPNMVGYTVTAYAEDRVTPIDIQDNGTITGTITKDTIIYIEYTPESNVEYIVKHCLQNLNRDGYADPQEGDSYNGISLYEKKTGTTGSDTEAQPLSIPGFEAQEFVNVEISGDGTTVVKINYDRSRVSLSYDTDGGSYVERQFAFTGQSVTVANRPLKDGYEFAGWYSEDGKEVKEGSIYELNTSETLKAHWTAQEVDYKVVYFKQQIDGTYVGGGEATPGRFSKKPNAGDPVVENGQLTIDVGLLNNNKFDYYYLNQEKTIAENQDVTYAGNGETIVKVYYDLIVYTLKFTLPGNNQQHGDYTFSASLDGKKDPLGNSVVISSDRKTYSFKARLGDNILDIFPTYQYVDGVCNDCSGWRDEATFGSWSPNIRSSRPKLDEELIGNGGGSKYSETGTSNMSFTRSTTPGWGCIRGADTTNTYWLQTIEAAEKGLEDKNNTNYHRDSSLDTDYTATLSQKEIFGFTKNGQEKGSKFYYLRNKYKLILNVGNNEIGYSEYRTINDVPYEKHLQEYLTQFTEDDRPQNIPEYYEFAGWYPNPEGTGNPVNVQTVTMPGFAKNDDQKQYILYGVWKPKQVTVTYIDAETEDIITKKDITAGETVEELTPEEKDGYIFDGWYTKAENGEYFRFDQPITKDTEIYAVWKPSKVVKYIIYYLEEGTNKELAEEETKKGISGTQVTVYPKTISGYVANDTSGQTITLKQSGNIVKFYYHPPRYYDYYLQYYYKDINGTEHNFGDKIKVSDESVLEGSSVIVRASGIPSGWILSEDETPSKRITVTSEEEKNVARFEIIRDFDFTVTGFDGVYDGLSHGVTVIPGYTEGDNEEFITQYGLSELGNEWTLEEAQYKYTDASKHTVYVKITHSLTGRSVIKGAEINIDKRPLLITGHGWSVEQPYTGEAYTSEEYDVEKFNEEGESGLVSGHEVTGLSYLITGTNAGTYEGAFSGEAVIKAGEQDVTGNYKVSTEEGTLKITKADIAKYVELTPKDASKVYDGTPLEAGVAIATGTAADTGEKALKVEYSVNGTDWTEDPSEITATEVQDSTTVQIRVSGPNYKDMLTGTEELEITQRPLLITGHGWSVEQPYTGEAYTSEEYDVEKFNEEGESGLVAGQEVTGLSYLITGTNAGTYEGAFSGEAVIKAGEQDVTGNYKVSTEEGTLKITKADIAKYVKLTPEDASKVYDGTPLEAGVAIATGTAADTGEKALKVEYSVNGTDWTEDPSEITATEVQDSTTVQIRVSGPNYKDMLTGTEELEITQRPLLITGHGWSVEQPYTGEAYTSEEYAVEKFNEEGESGLVAGQEVTGLSYLITGTNAGTYEGAFSGEAVIKAGEQDVTGNYKVSTEEGTLKITKADIAKYVKLTPEDASKVYDGTPLEAGVAIATGTAADTGEKALKVEYSVNGTDWTEDPSEITATEVQDSTTVQIRVSGPNYKDMLTGTEELEITQRPLLITGHGWSVEQPYTGEAYTSEEYDVEKFNEEGKSGLVAGQEVTGLSYLITGTNAGTYEGAFSGEAVIKAGEQDVTGNYKVSTEEGTLKITKADIAKYVELTPKDASKVYDGTPLEAGVAIATGTAADTGEKALKVEYSVNGTDWTEDPSEITATEVQDSTTVQIRVSGPNYKDMLTGTEELEITQRPLLITGHGWSVEQPYTGEAYTSEEYDVEKFNEEGESGLVAGQEVTGLSYLITGTNAGTYEGAFSGEAVIKAGEQDVTGNYKVSTEEGTLKITKADIAKYVELTPEDASKVYDGTPLEAGVAIATGTAADTGEKALKVEYSVNGTDWTEDPSEITATEVQDSTTVQIRVSGPNYKDMLTGTEELEITQRPLLITGHGWSVEQPYTGEAYTSEEYAVEKFNEEGKRGLVSGQEVTGLSYLITGTNAGEYKGAFSGEAVIKAGEKDVTGNYKVDTEEGTLKITKADIAKYVKLTPKDASKVYDGTPLEAGVAIATGTAADTGEKALKVEYSVNGTDWTEDPSEITATEVQDSTTVQIRVSGPNYKDMLTGTEELEITQRPLLITGHGWSVEQPYTGEAYTSEEYDVEKFNEEGESGLVAGQEVTGLSYLITGTNAGTYEGAFSGEAVIKAGEQDVTGNYKVSTEEGTLKITKADIAKYVKLTPEDASKVYDGTPLEAGVAIATGTAADTGEKALKVEYSVNGTDWTEDPSEITATEVQDSTTVQIRVSGPNYKDMLTGTEELEITQRPLLITGHGWSVEQPYTGEAYTSEEYAVEKFNEEGESGLVAGQEVTGLSYLITGTNAGTYEGAFSGEAVIKAGEQDVTGNYKVSTEEGTLKITKADIAKYVKLTPEDASKVYDGTPLEAGVAIATGTAADTGEKALKVEYSVNGTDWTEDPSEITATEVQDSTTVQIRVSGPNYKDMLTGTEELEITQRPLLITGHGWSVEQPYTGEAYTSEEYDVEKFNEEGKSGLVAGQEVTGLSYLITGTNAGTYEGAFSGEAVIKAGEQDVTGNYKVSTEEGTLKITKADIAKYVELTPKDASKVYDGTPLEAGVAIATGTAADTGEKALKVEYSVNGTDWTEDPSEITATEVQDSTTVQIRVSGPNYKDMLTGTEELEITQRPLLITGHGWSVEQPYTGEAYTSEEYAVEKFNEEGESGLVAGQEVTGLSYLITGTNAGTYEGAFSGEAVIKAGEQDVTGNYKVSTEEGTLKITKADIAKYVELTPEDASKVYDGTPLEAGVAIATGTAADTGEKALKVEYSVNGTDWTEDPSEITATEVQDSTTVQIRVSGPNYKDMLTGTEELEITQRPLLITGHGWSVEQPYTGEAYTSEEYAVEKFNEEGKRGLVSGQEVTGLSYLITGTNAGEYKGAFSGEAVIKAGEKDVTGNYKVDTEEGTLKITKADIAKYVKLTPKDASKVYDGTPLEAGVAIATGTAADTGEKALKVEYSVNGTDWTEDPSEITATEVQDSTTVQIRVSGPNYKDMVTGTEELEITQRPLLITGHGWSVEQPYTGEAYTSEEYAVEKFNEEGKSGLVSGQEVTGLSYLITGTNAGEYKGAFSGEAVIKAGEKDVTGNYKVDTEEGTLKITKADIAKYVKLTPKDASKVYDGTPLEAGVAIATGTAADTGEKALKVEYSVNGTDWTEDPSEITATEVQDSTTVQIRVSGPNYKDMVTGTEELEITQRPLLITGHGWSVEQPYTGEAYTSEEYAVEKFNEEGKSGLVSGQEVTGLSYLITGTNIGYYEGMFNGTAVIQSDTQDVTGNYIINTKVGSLTILGEVIYNGNNNTSGEVPVDENLYKLSDTITVLDNIENLKKDKAVFLGWSLTNHSVITRKEEAESINVLLAGDTLVMGEKSITLYAVWGIDENGPEGKPDETPDYLQYHLVYDGNGNTAGSVPTDSKLYNKDDEATLLGKGDLAREGATFLGWSLTENELITNAKEEAAAGILEGTVTFPEDKDLTVYAVWAIDENGPEEKPDETPDYLQYHLVYDGNGNTAGKVPTDSKLYNKGDEATLLGKGDLAREGATFLGWSLTENELITNAKEEAAAGILEGIVTFPEDKDLTVYAVWAIDENGPDEEPDDTPDYSQYRLIYNGNGNTAGKVPTDSKLYNKGDEATLLGKGDLAREGATFLGWSLTENELITKAEEEAAAGILEGTVTFPEDKDLTVYAVWAIDENGPEEKPDETPDYDEFSVTYDGNGATAGTVTDNAFYPSGYEVVVKANAFERTGYAFDGWKYAADGSEGEIWPTETFTITEDTTLYAHWEKDTKGGGEDGDEPDNIPDKYQTIFTYVSAGNGTVEPEGIEVHTTPRDENTGKYAEKTPVSPDGSIATADEGYAFDYWTSSNADDAGKKDFQANMPSFTGNVYTEDTTFTAYFAEDKKGGGSDPDDPTVPDTPDDIPDKYQIIFRYVSADETTGTVTGTVYEPYTFGDRENGFREIGEGIKPNADVTPAHAAGYAFDYWTIEGNEGAKDYTEEMSNLAAKLYTTDTTFVANFAEDNGGGGDDGNEPDGTPDKYQIVFRYVSADTTKGIVMGTTYETHTFTDENGNYLEASTVPTSPNADVTVAALSGNAFDYWNVEGQEDKDFTETMDTLKAATYTADTTFVANFDTDNKGGGDDADTPDNIPDKYQVIFRYVSANTAMGTVDGEPADLVEVRTLTTPAGAYLEAAANPVSPRGAVTVNPAAGHSFVSWTDGTTTDYSQTLATIKTMAYSTDTTFTANFSTNGTITVTKLLTMMDGMDEIPMASTESLTFHFGLFTDAAGTTLLGEEYVKSVTMQNNSSAQLVFENVPDGTYYVFETDANGNVLPYDTAQGTGTDSYVPVLNGPANAVTIDLAAGENAGQITVTNRYYMDPGGQYYIDAELNITKNVLDGKKAINPDQTFYAGVFTMNADGSYQLLDGQVIALSSNGTVTTNVPLGGEYGTDEITYYVFETDAQGNILASGDESFGYDITGGGAVTLSQENFRETVEITNTVMDDGDEPKTEEPTEEPNTEPDPKQTEEPTEKVTDTVKTNTVKTGDDTNVMMYLLILVIAGYVLVVTKKRRREN